MSENKKDLEALEAPEELVELAAPPSHELLAPVDEPLLSAPSGAPLLDTETSPVKAVVDVDHSHLEDDATLFDTIGNESSHIIPAPLSQVSDSLPTQEVPPVEIASPAMTTDTPSSLTASEMNPLSETPPEIHPQETNLPPIVPPLVSEMIHEETSLPVKKSHKILWIALVILLLLIGGLLAFWWFVLGGNAMKIGEYGFNIQPAKEQPSNYTEALTLEQQEYTNNINALNQALSEKNSAYCETIADTTIKLECQESVQALILSASGTLTDCQVLTLTGVRDRCISSVAQNEALNKRDKSLCARITDTTQAQMCREAVDVPLLANLIETKTATQETCQALEPTAQTSCLASIVEQDDTMIMADAVKSDSLEACQKLSTDDLQYVCFDAILMKRALTNADRSSCNLIHDAEKKSTCLAQVGARDDNTTFKSAITDKNLDACSAIQNETLRNRCHDAVTLLIVRDTRDATLCDSLVSTGAIDACKKSALQ